MYLFRTILKPQCKSNSEISNSIDFHSEWLFQCRWKICVDICKSKVHWVFFLCYFLCANESVWLLRTKWWWLEGVIIKSLFLNHPHRFVLCCSLPPSVLPSVLPSHLDSRLWVSWQRSSLGSGCLPPSSLNCWCESVFSHHVQRSLLIAAALANLSPCAAVQAVTSARAGSLRALCSLQSTLPLLY